MQCPTRDMGDKTYRTHREHFCFCGRYRLRGKRCLLWRNDFASSPVYWMGKACVRCVGTSKTGYRVWDRCRQDGLEALYDRSRRPVRQAALRTVFNGGHGDCLSARIAVPGELRIGDDAGKDDAAHHGEIQR